MTEDAKGSKTKKKRKSIIKFIKDIRSELKKVIWPNRQQLINNTITVLVACLVIGSIIWIADFLLSNIVDYTLAR